MNHPTEPDIERVVTGSPVLTQEQKKIIQEHISLCSFCREVYDTLREVHFEVRTHLLDEPSEQVKKMVDSIFQKDKPLAQILHLFPLQRISSKKIEQPLVIALAAQSPQMKPRYTTVQTLTTTDENTYIKILRDNNTGKYAAQVIADDPAFYENVLVSFEGQAGFYLTNSVGEIQLSDFDRLDFKDIHALIHLPRAVFTISEEEKIKIRSNEICTIQSITGEELIISFETAEQKAKVNYLPASAATATPHSLLLVTQNKNELHHFERNVVEIQCASLMESQEIKVF